MNIPKIREYMTPAPMTIAADTPLVEARAMMRDHQIRHLPVFRGEDLVGMLSERDVLFMESVHYVDWEHLAVEVVMSPTPLVVEADTPITRVISEMVARGYGSAMIQENGRLVGIFTNVDALAACDRLLGQAFPSDEARI